MTQPLPPGALPSVPDGNQPEHPTDAVPPDPTPDPPPAAAPERTRFADPVASAQVDTAAAEVERAQALVAPTEPPAEPDAAVTSAQVDTAAEEAERTQAVVEPAASEGQGDADAVAVPAGRGKGLVAVLAGLVVILALLAGLLGWKAYDAAGSGPVEASRRAALDAARASARLVFSYDYRHMDKDFKAGRATTTGKFQTEYDQATSKLVTDVAPRYKAVVVADVSDASVVRATESQVVTLVFLNQQSSSSLMTTPKVTQSRVEMTMIRKNGHWLVAEIKAL